MSVSAEQKHQLEAAQELIERAPVYARISVPTALVAGTASIVNAALTIHWLSGHNSRVVPIFTFILSWGLVLGVTLLTGGFLLWENHYRNHRPLVTPALRGALRAVLPAGFTAAAAACLFFWNGAAYSLGVAWMVAYGLALLGTSHFAPRPLIVLGTAFLATGLGTMVMVHLRISLLIGYSRSDFQTTLMMASTFGLYHLIYAVSTVLRNRRLRGSEA